MSVVAVSLKKKKNETSVTILLLGQELLGVAEILIINGALSLGLALMGSYNTGKVMSLICTFFFSSRRRHTRSTRDWSSDVCSSDLARGRSLPAPAPLTGREPDRGR